MVFKKHNSKVASIVYFMLSILGPGFIVMIADMDAGSITTAAVSGATFGYKLIIFQIILIPILYIIQSMTSQLGCVTGKGHGALIREFFGKRWAVFSTLTLLFVVFSALLTEFAGIAASGKIFDIPKIYTVGLSTLLLLTIISTGKYKKAEQIALIISLTSLAFIPAAFLAHPNYNAILNSLFGNQPLLDKNYLWLIAANVGAVIMPWMIYYQQSATVDKGLKACDIGFAKIDTLIGSIVTQILMIAVIVLTAATLYTHHIAPTTAKAIGDALIPLAGRYSGLLFAFGLYGSSMLAAFVVSMSFAWASGETWNYNHSLNLKFKDAKLFYLMYIFLIVLSAMIVLIPHISLISIMVDVEAFNGFVLPIVLGFLITLAGSKRVLGKYAYPKGSVIAVAFLATIMIVLGIFTSL